MSMLFDEPQKIGTAGNKNVIAFGIYNYPESETNTLFVSVVAKKVPDSTWDNAKKITLDSLIKLNPDGVELDETLVNTLLKTKQA